MDNPALNLFLASVERRAFRMARLATRQDADALDVVQEAMTRLVVHYAGATEAEWKPLFFRILENCLNDWHRQNARRQRWFVFGWQSKGGERCDSVSDSDDMSGGDTQSHDDALSPQSLLIRQRQNDAMMKVLQGLPLQQQQCFLLRCWEGMSVKETADAMGISSGSVKTHLYRARQKLHEVAERHDIQSEAGE